MPAIVALDIDSHSTTDREFGVARFKLSAQDRTRYQELAAAALVQHPHRLEFRGSPETLAWPALCANCGSASGENIPVSKAFLRRPRRANRGLGLFNYYRIYTVDMPFCPPCAARHRETLPRLSQFARYRTFILNPAHIATIGFAVLLAKIAPAFSTSPGAIPRASSGWACSA